MADQRIFAARALSGDSWLHDAAITISGGRISAIAAATTAGSADIRVDILLPAPGNLHSHSFQRAMAGMTERRAAGRENFWTWRDMMYRFLEHLSPDHVEAIAAQVFAEMLEAGYGSVGEFHYLHNQRGGIAYDTASELSQRIFAAAALTGIGLTHLPVLYSYGGAGQQPLAGGQLRFGNDLQSFLRLHEACVAAAKSLPEDTAVGVAPHSLRALSPDDLRAVDAAVPEGPMHIHAAEQVREVEDVKAWLGARPVDWLLDNLPVSPRWCLIHATHMTPLEVSRLAARGAVAGLCPITEGNLGDGFFDGPGWRAAGGRFGIGSDSNIRIALAEELRMLEYAQRLKEQARNVMAPADGSTGMYLFTQAAAGSAQALGRQGGDIAIGKWADLAALDGSHPALAGLTEEQLLDGFVFAAPEGLVTDVWSGGRHVVREGRHVRREEIRRRYRAALKELSRLI